MKGELEALRRALLDAEVRSAAALGRVPPGNRASGRNLVHYLELRRHDLRELQGRLAEQGLSSLGRCEAHALATLDAVIGVLDRLEGDGPWEARADPRFAESRRLLARRTETLLGPRPAGRTARLMVTAPSEAAGDPKLLEHMLDAGMECLRINWAHDDPHDWEAMIGNLRRAEERTGRSCRIEMDLAGPKLRTGSLPPGPAVVKVRPRRDELGRVVEPARVWLTAAERPAAPPQPASATLPVPEAWLAALPGAGSLRLRDARGRRRVMKLAGGAEGGRWALLRRTAYILEGTVVSLEGATPRSAAVGALSPLPGSILVRTGDTLRLTRDQDGGDPERRAIPCTLGEAFETVRPGEPIWLDDGRVGGTIGLASPEEAEVHVTHAASQGSRLRADKGINLPETDLAAAAVTADDERLLPLAARHADMLGLSFAERADDVHRARALLDGEGGGHVGIVLKVETRRGFRALPQLLLAALEHDAPCGVMIARGDLAVECGYERLAEAQEEVLWLAEAAHVPVIWATQVLESLAKTGQPSRAEITDAAMAARAECVMLNKGPRVLDALRALDDVLVRMDDHQEKKQSLLRRLRSFPEVGAGAPVAG